MFEYSPSHWPFPASASVNRGLAACGVVRPSSSAAPAAVAVAGSTTRGLSSRCLVVVAAPVAAARATSRLGILGRPRKYLVGSTSCSRLARGGCRREGVAGVVAKWWGGVGEQRELSQLLLTTPHSFSRRSVTVACSSAPPRHASYARVPGPQNPGWGPPAAWQPAG